MVCRLSFSDNMFYCQRSPVEWIMSILRSLAGHLAGLLVQLGLNIASLAMNRLLYSIFTFSLFPTLFVAANKKDQSLFFVSLDQCAGDH